MRLADATSSAKRRRDALGNPSPIEVSQAISMLISHFGIGWWYHCIYIWLYYTYICIYDYIIIYIYRYIYRYTYQCFSHFSPCLSCFFSMFTANCPVISIFCSVAGSQLRHAAAARHVLRSPRNGEDHGGSTLRGVLRCGEKHVVTSTQRRLNNL